MRPIWLAICHLKASKILTKIKTLIVGIIYPEFLYMKLLPTDFNYRVGFASSTLYLLWLEDGHHAPAMPAIKKII